jgi:hypothetical protein
MSRLARSIFMLVLTFIAVIAFVSGCSDDIAEPPADASSPDLTFADKAVQRSFDEFMAAQGTFCWPDGEGGCFDFEPPMKNFFGWTDPDVNFNALFEYLGNADAYLQEQSNGEISLDTEITGRVSERPLADGRALLNIKIKAENILAWVTQIEDYYLDPLVFGSRVDEVLSGAPPAIGDFHLTMKVIVPEQNAPLPDIFGLYFFPEPGAEVVHVTVSAQASGVLHEGSGYPEGTIGRVSIQQVFPSRPDGDIGNTWPVERIDFHVANQH